MSEARPLHAGFLHILEKYPNRPALEVEGKGFTYSELWREASRLAATLDEHCAAEEPPLTAVFAYRSATAFAGVLASLFRGHGYVPLNRTFPPERTKLMLERSGCRAVIVDRLSERQLPAVLADIPGTLLLLLPEHEDVSEARMFFPQHMVLGRNQLIESDRFLPKGASPDSIAYLLFTSGSTGTPKGVMVAHRNVTHYVRTMSSRYGIIPEDRCSQTFDMTFDLSVHDMFLAWENGACLCCPSQKTLLKPGRFIKDARLTVWFSVPSTAMFMKRLGEMRPDMYPELRLSLFCGEALPEEVALNWMQAAPNSVIENIYGPTELTIACTAYRWDADRSPAECELGVVPIGEPLEGMELLIVDDQLKEVPPATPGELLMTGPQVTLGYWRDAERTVKAFVVPAGQNRIYYRTGDRVRRPAPGKPLVYLGRVDNQIKILGHRVELGEIEAALREESGVAGVLAVGWPISSSGASGVEAFMQAEQFDTAGLLAKLKSRLPLYMVPRRIHLLPEFPLNANGKFDRIALTKLLSE